MLHFLYGGIAIPGQCRLPGPPPGGRTFYTAAMPSLAIAALPGLRPAAALSTRQQCHPWPLPPCRASARRPHLRAAVIVRVVARGVPSDESSVAAGLCPADCGMRWQADSADRRPAATFGNRLRGVSPCPVAAGILPAECRMPKRASIERPEGRRAPIRRGRIGLAGSVRRDDMGLPLAAAPTTSACLPRPGRIPGAGIAFSCGPPNVT
jgi:hypothetical protein